jgi:hypothetical protein
MTQNSKLITQNFRHTANEYKVLVWDPISSQPLSPPEWALLLLADAVGTARKRGRSG